MTVTMGTELYNPSGFYIGQISHIELLHQPFKNHPLRHRNLSNHNWYIFSCDGVFCAITVLYRDMSVCTSLY